MSTLHDLDLTNDPQAEYKAEPSAFNCPKCGEAMYQDAPFEAEYCPTCYEAPKKAAELAPPTDTPAPTGGEKLAFRIGRKQRRALLDKSGLVVALFSPGKEAEAQATCDLLNNALTPHPSTPAAYASPITKQAREELKRLAELAAGEDPSGPWAGVADVALYEALPSSVVLGLLAALSTLEAEATTLRARLQEETRTAAETEREKFALIRELQGQGKKLFTALTALAGMWNQYCPPPTEACPYPGHMFMSAGEEAEEVLASWGLLRADETAIDPDWKDDLAEAPQAIRDLIGLPAIKKDDSAALPLQGEEGKEVAGA